MSGFAAQVYVEGIGVWAPRLPGWEHTRRVLAGLQSAPEPVARPAPVLLPPTERRRAPDTVSISMETALEACAAAGRESASLPSAFASAWGDLAIVDYMCATLAATPLHVSPTKFHNSVHNAAAGYWSIATDCMRPYTALCAGAHSFGAGLLEACAQCVDGSEAVLLVAYDVEARGPLAPVVPSRNVFAVALVLAPERGPGSRAELACEVVAGAAAQPTAANPEHLALIAGNGTASALPLLEALASDGEREILCRAAPALSLALRTRQLAA